MFPNKAQLSVIRERNSVMLIESVIAEAVAKLGYNDLSREQNEAVINFVLGKDVFVSLPTGGGKSLCYLILPIVFDLLCLEQRHHSIVVVVSPLKSLMVDQVAKFSDRGVKSALVGRNECRDTRGIVEGEYQIVLMSPESMLSELKWREMFRSQVYQENLKALVIDEAHCVVKWGAEFRTEFANISEMRSIIPHGINVMALTATATTTTRQTIIANLDMRNCHLVVSVPSKRNIKYQVRHKENIDSMLLHIVNAVCVHGLCTDRTIIFCQTYIETLEVFKNLICWLGRRKALHASPANSTARARICEKYDASTASSNQNHVVEAFTNPDGIVRVVVATVAFGMGLDSPNVRNVIHWGAPDSVETYVQETGRGGRDGKLCNAVLYYGTLTKCSSTMKDYCKNSIVCCRQLLMSHFTEGSQIEKPVVKLHDCCHLCEQSCTCDSCTHAISLPSGIANLFEADSPCEAIGTSSSTATAIQEQLLKYRSRISPSPQNISYMMIGPNLITGLSDKLVEYIANNHSQARDVKTLLDFGVGSYKTAVDILAIINKYTTD